MKKIKIRDTTIRLGQLLKLADIASTGGEAKVMIQGGDVRVNGHVEIRRGAQLTSGDVVTVGEISVVVE
nr:RNA-binding S4 domain-containing protein [Desulfobulbaceae bacterium]